MANGGTVLPSVVPVSGHCCCISVTCSACRQSQSTPNEEGREAVDPSDVPSRDFTTSNYQRQEAVPCRKESNRPSTISTKTKLCAWQRSLGECKRNYKEAAPKCKVKDTLKENGFVKDLASKWKAHELPISGRQVTTYRPRKMYTKKKGTCTCSYTAVTRIDMGMDYNICYTCIVG